MPKNKQPQKEIKKSRSRLARSGFRVYCVILILVGVFNLTSLFPSSTQLNPTPAAEPEALIIPLTIEQPAEPTRITIGQKIDKLIESHSLSEDGMPTVSSQNASYFAASALAGQPGNMILYGHNKRDIFGKLHDVKVGEVIEITNSDTSVVRYTITQIETVETTDTQWLKPTENAVITLYTCTGWMDSKRLIVRGELIP